MDGYVYIAIPVYATSIDISIYDMAKIGKVDSICAKSIENICEDGFWKIMKFYKSSMYTTIYDILLDFFLNNYNEFTSDSEADENNHFFEGNLDDMLNDYDLVIKSYDGSDSKFITNLTGSVWGYTDDNFQPEEVEEKEDEEDCNYDSGDEDIEMKEVEYAVQNMNINSSNVMVDDYTNPFN